MTRHRHRATPTPSRFRRLVAFILATLTISSGLIFSGSEASYAAEPTVDNPVIFTVRGGLVSGAIRYDIDVDGVFAGNGITYQSFRLVYPIEFLLNATGIHAQCATSPTGTSCPWTISSSSSSTDTTSDFIIKGTAKTAAELRSDIDALFFTLRTNGVFPPENSKVSISASAEKITSYIDSNNRIHYYLFLNETRLNNLGGDYRLNPTVKTSGWLPMTGSNFTDYDATNVTSNVSITSGNYNGVACSQQSPCVITCGNGVGSNPKPCSFPRTNINWVKAYNIAKKITMQDPREKDNPNARLTGYLATITSQAEQDKVYNDIAKYCGWLGGTRLLKGAHGTASGSPIVDDPQVLTNTELTNSNSGRGGATAAATINSAMGLTATYSPTTANSGSQHGGISLVLGRRTGSWPNILPWSDGARRYVGNA